MTPNQATRLLRHLVMSRCLSQPHLGLLLLAGLGQLALLAHGVVGGIKAGEGRRCDGLRSGGTPRVKPLATNLSTGHSTLTERGVPTSSRAMGASRGASTSMLVFGRERGAHLLASGESAAGA